MTTEGQTERVGEQTQHAEGARTKPLGNWIDRDWIRRVYLGTSLQDRSPRARITEVLDGESPENPV
ncbi:hypothetical protein ACFL3C_01355 [Patescibacteria group bacterium]